MKLKELLENFCFDGYFVDYHESRYLSISPVYTHRQLKKIAEGKEGDYHVEVVDIGFGQLRVAICSNELTLDGQSAIAYIETEKSFQKRSQNCCNTCGRDLSCYSFDTEYAYVFSTNVLNSWNPLSEELFQVDHDKEDMCGQICGDCKKKDPSLAKYIANMRVLNSMG